MSKHDFLVLSALGADRPGLVAQVTRFLVERGCSVEESRMVLLGAEFGIMALVSGGPDSLQRVVSDVKELEARSGLLVLVKPTSWPATPAPVLAYSVSAYSLDQEGIVHSISDRLYQLGVNIVSVQTTAYNAPVTGSPLFRMEALIHVPAELPIGRVREAMAEVARALNLDIDVGPARI